MSGGRCPRCGIDFASGIHHLTACPALAPEYRAFAESLVHLQEAIAHVNLLLKYGVSHRTGHAEDALVRSEKALGQLLQTAP